MMKKTLQHYINRMNELLDQLVETATKLRDVSQTVVSEEELAPTQRRQEEILAELDEVDRALHRYYGSVDIDQKTHKQLHDKLHEFQLLNQEFIDNLNTSHGLIQFELSSSPERASEEEAQEPFLYPWHRLNKILFSPNRSKTIESKENEET